MIFKCLLFHLRTLHNDAVPVSREEVEQLDYPVANVTLNESAQNQHSAVGVEWGMLKFLTFPGWGGCDAELEVERHIGSCLASFFNIENCITLWCVLYL